MMKPLGRCCASRISIFSIFFAVFFSACAYFYFQYSYTKFTKVRFDEWVLYQGEEIFAPLSDSYTLYFYSSHIKEQKEFIKSMTIPAQKPVLAIDVYQYHGESTQDHLLFVSAGIDTILKYVNRFKITELPALVDIEREGIYLYYQSSRVQVVPKRSLLEQKQ